MEDDPLALETRRRLYEAVRLAPGIGGREAQRAAATGWGETVYHLDRLTESGLLHRERSGFQDHYFVANVPLGDRSLLRLMRSPSARRLLLALLAHEAQTIPEISTASGLSPGRLSVHLRRFLEGGLLRTGRRGRYRTFDVAERDRVIALLVTYRTGFGDTWTERFLETWSELFRP
jgi:predicted transcriptional regulator